MPRLVTVALLAGLALPAAGQDGSRPFTPEDALNVRTLSVEDLSPDGRWAAVTVRTHRDRLNVDHFRFGDPTYVAPSLEELILVDTRTGDEMPLLDGRVQVDQVAWSPDGRHLAWLRYDDGSHHLETWSVETGEVRRVDLRSDRPLASNSTNSGKKKLNKVPCQTRKFRHKTP